MDHRSHFNEFSKDPTSYVCECHDNSKPKEQKKQCIVHPFGMYYRRPRESNQSCEDVYNAYLEHFIHQGYHVHCVLAMMIGVYNFTDAEIDRLNDKLGFDCRLPRQILINEIKRRSFVLGKKLVRRLNPFTHSQDELKVILRDMNTFEHTEGVSYHFSSADMTFLQGQMERLNHLLEYVKPKKRDALPANLSADEIFDGVQPANASDSAAKKSIKKRVRKECTFVDPGTNQPCTSVAQKAGRCNRHGARAICGFVYLGTKKQCTVVAQKDGRCGRHGAKAICTFVDPGTNQPCPNQAVSKAGRCGRHGARAISICGYKTVTITVNKQSKDTRLGLHIGNRSLKVISVIGTDSLFFDKDLKEGDVILAINGTEVSTITEVEQLAKDAVGKLTLVVRREEKTQVGSSEIPRAPMR